MGRKRVKDVHVVNKIMPHLMPRRTDAEIYAPIKLDVTNLVKYLAKKNRGRAPDKKITLFHALVMASAKMIYNRPFMNYYLKARKLYQRDSIRIAFVSRREFRDDSDELLINMAIDDDDTIDTIAGKVVAKVTAARDENNGIDTLLKILTVLPTPILAAVAGMIKFGDWLGVLPTSFTDAEPDYATLYLANLGSIKGAAVFHHLNTFGTNSLFATIGVMHQEELIIDGKKQIRDIIDVSVTLDERITDGFRALRAFDLIKECINRPELLDEPVSKEIKL